jgi:hypothetical protein
VSDEPTKEELQDELRKRDLPVSGTKAELQQRLEDAEEDDAAEMTKSDLQEELRKRDLPVSGTKAELQQRLEDHEAGDDADDDQDADTDEDADTGEDADSDDGGAAVTDDGDEGDEGDGQAAPEESSDGAGAAASTAPDEPAPAGDGGGTRRPRAREIARLAARQLASLSRHSIEGISGLAREGDEWRVDVEVLEVSRVPPSTDVLGTYAVYVDEDGELISYERVGRFVRGQAGGGDG